MRLKDIVNFSQPVKVPGDATVEQALVAMMENKVDSILVDRSSRSDAYGIVTKWDLVEGPIAHGMDLGTTPVMEFARKPLVSVNNLELDIQWVAKKMANERVSKLAVFDGENFLGFVADTDVLRAAVEHAKSSGSREGGKA